jgi:hypothetical protein
VPSAASASMARRRGGWTSVRYASAREPSGWATRGSTEKRLAGADHAAAEPRGHCPVGAGGACVGPAVGAAVGIPGMGNGKDVGSAVGIGIMGVTPEPAGNGLGIALGSPGNPGGILGAEALALAEGSAAAPDPLGAGCGRGPGGGRTVGVSVAIVSGVAGGVAVGAAVAVVVAVAVAVAGGGGAGLSCVAVGAGSAPAPLPLLMASITTTPAPSKMGTVTRSHVVDDLLLRGGRFGASRMRAPPVAAEGDETPAAGVWTCPPRYPSVDAKTGGARCV